MDPSIYESLQKEKITVGDVIYIEANSGAVKVIFPVISNFATALVTNEYRGLGDQMLMLQNTIWKRKSTCHFLKETSTRKKKLYKI